MATEPFAPPMSFFKRGRHFTTFLGLDSGNLRPPASRSWKNSEVRERDIWRRLIIGAMAVARWAHRPGAVIVSLPRAGLPGIPSAGCCHKQALFSA